MCLDYSSSPKLFSTLDLQLGYSKLEGEQEDKPKTAIITKYGLFEYNIIPSGLCNVPSTFQRTVEIILSGLQWESILVYLDDIIVIGSTFEEHMRSLLEALQRMTTARLKLTPAKCELLKTEVLFLCHIVCQDGIRPKT